MCVCGDVIGSYDDTLDICVLRFFRTRLVKLVPIAHGSNAEQAYGVQEIPNEPYVHPLDEIVRTIRIVPLREGNIQVYPRTYIRNLRIRKKDMTVADNPFPQPYVQDVSPRVTMQPGCRSKISATKLSKKTQKDLLKKSSRAKKDSNQKTTVRYTDLSFRPVDDGPKIIEQIIIPPPNPIPDEVVDVESYVGSVEEVEIVQQSVSESLVATQNSDNENLSVIHDYLEFGEDLIPVDYGPLVPPVEASDIAMDVAHEAAVLEELQHDPMLSSTAAVDEVDLSAYADFDEDLFNELIEFMHDL